MPRRELAGAPSPARQKMWSAMRMQRQFRTGEIIELCGGLRRKAAEKYIAALVRAGYLRVGERSRGCKGQVYSLARNTGPFAPRVGERGVTLDPNEAIVKERTRHAELLKEIRRVEERLGRLGAYVEKFQSSASDGARAAGVE